MIALALLQHLAQSSSGIVRQRALLALALISTQHLLWTPTKDNDASDECCVSQLTVQRAGERHEGIA